MGYTIRIDRELGEQVIAECGPSAFAVYFVLAGYCDRQGECWPSVDTIGDKSGLKPRQVRNLLDSLERNGYIERVRRTGQANLYRIVQGVQQNAPPVNTPCNELHTTPATECSPPRQYIAPKDIPRTITTEDIPTTCASGPEKPNQKSLFAKSITVEQFIEKWNAIEGVNHCRKVTPKRKAAFIARSKEPGWLSDLDAAIDRVARSSFCKGGGSTGWQADIDWFLRPDTIPKILEGKYDNRTKQQNNSPARIR